MATDESQVHQFNMPRLIAKATQELQGVASMMIYDGKIDDTEIEFLEKWLLSNDEYMSGYPLEYLKILLANILKDGIVDLDERKQLLEFLTSIATSPEGDILPTNIFTENPSVKFRNKTFVVTGEFIFASRGKVIEEIIIRGGRNTKNPSTATDYLVVGDLGSENYKFGKFGRKIESAMNINNKRNNSIQIIKEKTFIETLIV